MEFYETNDARFGMREIPSVIAELLRQIPRWAESEQGAEDERLFPSPAPGEGEDQLRADWQAYVQPDLHEYFLSTRQIVEADLRGMEEEGEGWTLEFSHKHGEAWLNALNQARLMLAERHGFDEDELAGSGPVQVKDERELALFQIHFYGMIQHWLIEILDGSE